MAEVGFVGDNDVQGVGAVVGLSVRAGEDDLVGADGDTDWAFGDVALGCLQLSDGRVHHDAVFRAKGFAFEDVGDAEEAGDAGGDGVLEHVWTVANLEDLAGVHDGNAVADVAGLGEVVGDHEHGEIQISDEAAEFAAEGEGHAFVEGGEGFVEQERLGAADEGTGQGGALGLAAGDPGGRRSARS